MTDIRFKSKPHGLRLAQQHRSAEGQASADKVYERIAKAQKLGPKEDEAARVAHSVFAVRMGIDRIRRIGERIQENINVAPIDAKLMTEEFEYLKDRMSKIFDKNFTEVIALDQMAVVEPAQMRQQFERLVEAVFQGTLSPLDRIDRIGTLLDPEADPLAISFEGTFTLAAPVSNGQFRSGIDTLSDRLGSLGAREAIPIDHEYSGEHYIEQAVQRVSEGVLTNARSAKIAHTDHRSLVDLSLVFGDGLGKK